LGDLFVVFVQLGAKNAIAPTCAAAIYTLISISTGKPFLAKSTEIYISNSNACSVDPHPVQFDYLISERRHDVEY